LLVLWVLWLMAQGSWVQTVIGMGTVLPVTGMRLAVFTTAALYASVAMGILTVIDIIRVLAGGRLPAESSPEDPAI